MHVKTGYGVVNLTFQIDFDWESCSAMWRVSKETAFGMCGVRRTHACACVCSCACVCAPARVCVLLPVCVQACVCASVRVPVRLCVLWTGTHVYGTETVSLCERGGLCMLVDLIGRPSLQHPPTPTAPLFSKTAGMKVTPAPSTPTNSLHACANRHAC